MRPLTGPAAAGLGSVLQPTRVPAVGDRSVVGRQDHNAAVLSPLYVGVPVACACILLSLVVLGVLLLRHGRGRHSDDRQKTVALLPSYRTSPSSPSPLFRHEVSAVELCRSHEPCICLHCNRPHAFVPTPACTAQWKRGLTVWAKKPELFRCSFVWNATDSWLRRRRRYLWCHFYLAFRGNISCISLPCQFLAFSASTNKNRPTRRVKGKPSPRRISSEVRSPGPQLRIRIWMISKS